MFIQVKRSKKGFNLEPHEIDRMINVAKISEIYVERNGTTIIIIDGKEFKVEESYEDLEIKLARLGQFTNINMK